MKKEFITGKEKPGAEPIVIPDECGDSLWDAVLDQKNYHGKKFCSFSFY